MQEKTNEDVTSIDAAITYGHASLLGNGSLIIIAGLTLLISAIIVILFFALLDSISVITSISILSPTAESSWKFAIKFAFASIYIGVPFVISATLARWNWLFIVTELASVYSVEYIFSRFRFLLKRNLWTNLGLLFCLPMCVPALTAYISSLIVGDPDHPALVIIAERLMDTWLGVELACFCILRAWKNGAILAVILPSALILAPYAVTLSVVIGSSYITANIPAIEVMRIVSILHFGRIIVFPIAAIILHSLNNQFSQNVLDNQMKNM